MYGSIKGGRRGGRDRGQREREREREREKGKETRTYINRKAEEKEMRINSLTRKYK